MTTVIGWRAAFACALLLGGSTVAWAWREGGALQLPARGPAVEGFVPEGYRILYRRDADLNGDGLLDTVVVIARDDPVLEYDEPRPLLILLQAPDGGYRLSGRSDTAVDTAPPGVHGDHFNGIAVRGRTIVLTSSGVSGGGAEGGSTRQKIAYRHGGWYLIGIDRETWSYPARPGADTVEQHNAWLCPQLHLTARELCAQRNVSANFITGKIIDKWSIYPSAGDIGEAPSRTVVRRRTLNPPVWGPLTDEPY